MQNRLKMESGRSSVAVLPTISPLGLHWPELDEDLSFRGLLEGDYGQSRQKAKA